MWFATKHSVSKSPDGLARVKAETSAAIGRTNNETAAINERIEALSCQLASALGDVEGIFYEREPEDERAASQLERRYLETIERSKHLRRQLAVLRDIEALLHGV